MSDPLRKVSVLYASPTQAPLPPSEEGLKHGGGGGNSGGMEPASREYVDLKLEAAMTRIDGKFDLLNQRLGDLKQQVPQWWSILGAVMIGTGAILAALAFGGDRFDGGLNLSTQMQEQLERDRRQDERLEQVLNRLDAQFAAPSTPAPPAAANSGE